MTALTRRRSGVVSAGAARDRRARGVRRVARRALTFTRRSARLPDRPNLVEVHGGRAYIAGGKTLTIVDVSNPAAPKRLGAYTLPGEDLGLPRRRLDWSTSPPTSSASASSTSRTRRRRCCAARSRCPARPRTSPSSARRRWSPTTCRASTSSTSSNTAKPVSLGSFFLEGYARDVVSVRIDRLRRRLRRRGSTSSTCRSRGRSSGDQSQQSATRTEQHRSCRNDRPAGRSSRYSSAAGCFRSTTVTKPAAPVRAATFRTPSGRPRARRCTAAWPTSRTAGKGCRVVDLSTPCAPALVGELQDRRSRRETSR